MHSFLKTLGLGILYTLLLPFIVLIWVLYGVYCIGIFIYMFFKSIIVWLKGGTPFGDLPEEVEAKRILIGKQEQQEMMNQAFINMYQNHVLQPQAENNINQTEISVQGENNIDDTKDIEDENNDEVSW